MNLHTAIHEALEAHPVIESAQDVPAEYRKAILIAYRDEADTATLVDIYRGSGWDADDSEIARQESIAAQAWQCLEGRPDDLAEYRRLVDDWIWRQAAPHIEEALQDARSEEAA